MNEKRKRASKADRESPCSTPPLTTSRQLPLEVNYDATPSENARRVAKQILAPETSAFRVLNAAEGRGGMSEFFDAASLIAELRSTQKAIKAGDLSSAEAMLISQATGLQLLSVRMFESAMVQKFIQQFETYMRLGLKAQAQSRQTLETLAALKHGPAILARNAQVNVAHGPQQVNNGLTLARAGDSENSPIQLSSPDELCADNRASSGTGRADTEVAPVGAVDRPNNC